MHSDNIFVLSEKKFQDAKNLPVIQIVHKKVEEKIDFSSYEALIFSSKNGIYAIDKIDEAWKSVDSFAIGSATSEAIISKGGILKYEARSSYGDDFANEIKEQLNGKKALFLRAKVVTSSLNKILIEAGVILDEVIVYETICGECKSFKTPPKNSKIIFSSPSTIECFFRCFKWDDSYSAIVIGIKTASFMPSNIKYTLSKKQTIPSCIKIARII